MPKPYLHFLEDLVRLITAEHMRLAVLVIPPFSGKDSRGVVIIALGRADGGTRAEHCLLGAAFRRPHARDLAEGHAVSHQDIAPVDAVLAPV